MGTKDARVDAYIERAAPFARPILKRIRKAVHAGCPEVDETIKWGMPAFMYKGPLCGMAAFKAHATFGFWKHALLLKGKPSPARSNGKAMGSFGRIATLEDLPSDRQLIALVKRAAALNEQGIKVVRERTVKAPLATPPDLLAALRKRRTALRTFQEFSPSHRREYVEWIVEAKRDETRRRRIETAVEWMAEGRARNWKYAKREEVKR
jgi:uncharacterized protein YdeI (YjbR/CyaY-like superfamily)